MMKYNAFISYRRNNGFLIAQLVFDQLSNRGLNCFLDLEELSSGTFDDKILSAIADAPDFILILSEGALDRCLDKEDWVRREIIEAVKQKKNIIPILFDGFKWPKDILPEMPEEIRQLETINAIPGTQVYLSAMIEKLISYMTDVDYKKASYEMYTKRRLNETIHIATSNLTVVDTIMQGWECEKVFQKLGCKVEKHPYKWSNKVLNDLLSGKVDLAIYNKETCLTFNQQHEDRIRIIRDVCSSMGGRNFYILASKYSRWKDMTLEQFKNNLDSTVVIGVSKSSDMYRNLLYILDLTEQDLTMTGVKIMDYHSDQGLDIFNFIPNLLLIAGQDIRFLAEQTGDYIEVISYDNFPNDKKQMFLRNSINSLLIGPSGIEKLKDVDIDQIGVDLMVNFYRNAMDKTALVRIKEKLSRQLENICDDDSIIDYITSKIIFETYRFM